jgi:hypothetical protein
MRVDNCERAHAERERLSWGNLGFWLDEYTDQVSIVLLSEYASELQNACSLVPSINEDHNFRKFGAKTTGCVGTSVWSFDSQVGYGVLGDEFGSL